MKQANISIDTAKAMYQQGGAAKQFALDNFTEQELTKKALPKTWEEAIIGKEGWYVLVDSSIKIARAYPMKTNKNLWPTRELAEACLAMSQLAVLRDAYRGGWKMKIGGSCFGIYFSDNKLVKAGYRGVNKFLSFPTPELRDEFLANFESLILKAQPLL